jgi:hypothetical protein
MVCHDPHILPFWFICQYRILPVPIDATPPLAFSGRL